MTDADEKDQTTTPVLATPEGYDQRLRSEAVIRLLDEWMADDSGYDESTRPELKQALDRDRPSYRKLFDASDRSRRSEPSVFSRHPTSSRRFRRFAEANRMPADHKGAAM